jgi:cell cycle arrest protein BUB3
MEHSETDRVIVTGSWDASIMIWDERGLECVSNIPQVNEVFCMDVREELVIVGTANKLISIWDLRNTKSFIAERKSKLSAHQTRSVKIFPDKKRFALGSVEGRVAIDPIHENDPELVGYAFKPHVDKKDNVGHPVNAISIHGPTSHFATGASDQKAYLWDVERKRRIMELGSFPSSIAAMDFSQDGSKLAIGCSYTHDLASPPDPMPPNRIYIRSCKFPSKTKSK